MMAPRLANAIKWHADLCSKVAAQTDDFRPTYIRVVCLLAIVIQACAVPELWQQLMSILRPCTEDKLHPLWKSTEQFGQRFAGAIPPREDASGSATGDPFHSTYFALPGTSDGTGAAARAAWVEQLTQLLLRLQVGVPGARSSRLPEVSLRSAHMRTRYEPSRVDRRISSI